MVSKKKKKPNFQTFQDTILNLQKYWSKHGCIILQPYDIEVGAGTFHPATTLRSLGPNLCRRLTFNLQDGQLMVDTEIIQIDFNIYYQFQVIIKPLQQISKNSIYRAYQ